MQVDGPHHFTVNRVQGAFWPLGRTLLRDRLLQVRAWHPMPPAQCRWDAQWQALPCHALVLLQSIVGRAACFWSHNFDAGPPCCPALHAAGGGLAHVQRAAAPLAAADRAGGEAQLALAPSGVRAYQAGMSVAGGAKPESSDVLGWSWAVAEERNNWGCSLGRDCGLVQ